MRYRSKTNSRKQENKPLRADYADANPFCEVCPKRSTPMDDVHHISGGRLGRWDVRSNLLSVCRPCHDELEADKTGGRIRALWLKMKKGELNQVEFHQVSGMYLAGWLDSHEPSDPAVRALWCELVAYVEGAES